MKLTNKILEAVNKGIKFALDDFNDNEEIQGQTNSKVKYAGGMQQYIIDCIKSGENLTYEMWGLIKNNLSHYLNLLGITEEQFYIIRYMVGRYNTDELDGDLYKIFEENKPLFSNKFRKITSKKDLQKIIVEAIKENGPNCDLNWIDVSGVTDMSFLFNFTEYLDYPEAHQFKTKYPFNCDISKWDVSNVKDMEGMFCGCTEFNQDISNWNVSKVVNMEQMFTLAKKFNQPIGKWDVSNVKILKGMFIHAESFNQDISNWKFKNDADIFDTNDVSNSSFNYENIFFNCPIEEKYKPKQLQNK